jgi:hypothetical protein
MDQVSQEIGEQDVLLTQSLKMAEELLRGRGLDLEPAKRTRHFVEQPFSILSSRLNTHARAQQR